MAAFGAEDMMHLVFLMVYGLAFLLGVVGNGCIIFLTGFQGKKTVPDLWFLNLAIADFIFSSFLPFRVLPRALDSQWPLGNFLRKLTIIVTSLNMFAKVFLLTLMNAEHCISVACPGRPWARSSPRLASVAILVVWLLALAFSLRYQDLWESMSSSSAWKVASGGLHHVPESLPLTERSMGSAATHFLAGFLIPLALVVTCYVLLAATLRRSHFSPSEKPHSVLLVLMLTFFLCWLPYHIFNFLQVSGGALPAEIKTSLDIGILFAYGAETLDLVVCGENLEHAPSSARDLKPPMANTEPPGVLLAGISRCPSPVEDYALALDWDFQSY
nr:chemokine-like receptor 1 [Pelodiscus sinensis]|eukprot:XP_006129929.1 chemokine-like receptor 1 [Pelodiscus sinensis]